MFIAVYVAFSCLFFFFFFCMLLFPFALCRVLRLNGAPSPTKFPSGLIKVFGFWCVVYALIQAAELQRWIYQPVITWKREDAYSRVPSPPRQMMRSMQSEISSKPADREKHLCTQSVGHIVEREWRLLNGFNVPFLQLLLQRFIFFYRKDDMPHKVMAYILHSQHSGYLTVSYSFQSFFIGYMANKARGDVALTEAKS